MAGIECEFVEKLPKAVQSDCPICLLVLRDPYQAICCGKSFCKECVDQIKARNGTCPTCKTENFFSYPNKGLQQSLYDFEVYCSFKREGCEWRGELRELDKHLNSDPPADKSLEGCPFTVLSCPLSHTGCEVKLPRKDIVIHVNKCFMKQTALVHTLMQDNKALHTQLQTANGRLKTRTAKLQSVKGEKQYLEQHVAELEGEIKQLKETVEVVSNTGQPIVPVQFYMTNFKQHQDDEDWYSQPFYTHPHGYKMCLRVNPKGYGSGKGTHLGVTFHLMRGKFDDQLKWPFRGDITYQLVNQEEDKDHIVDVVHFKDSIPDEVNVSKRVTELGEQNAKGTGHAKLLPLSVLQPKYLKKDCIKLHIVKVVLTQK